MLNSLPPLISVKNMSKSFGATQVLKNISLDIQKGEFLTLLGPSGCGKTTLLRILSGFETPCAGRLYVDGKDITDQSPQERNLHTVFQSYALFPHLSVFENVAFSLRCKKILMDEIEPRVFEALRLVHLEDFHTRNVTSLSGGQQQRVAIARAIVDKPQVLLLDEPLSSLDYRLRKTMQYELKQLQMTLGITFVFVTHDQEEALSMSDRIVVFNHGHIEQIGTPREIYETPTNLYTARFIGEVNVFDVDVLSVDGATLMTKVENITIQCANDGSYKVDDKLHLVVRPEDLRVWSQQEVTDTTTMIPGKIISIVYKGSTVDLKVELNSGKIVNASEFFDEDDGDLEYSLDEQVWLQWLLGWEVLLPYED